MWRNINLYYILLILLLVLFTKSNSTHYYPKHAAHIKREITAEVKLQPKTLKVQSSDSPVSEKFFHYFESDNFCKLARLIYSDQNQDIDSDLLGEKLLALPNLMDHSPSEVDELEQFIQKSYLYEESEKSTNFYRALYLGGILSGVENLNPDYSRALELFTAMQRLDRKNAIYPLLKAQIKIKANYPSQAIKAEFLSALSATEYRNPQRNLILQIHERGLSSPSGRLLSSLYLAQIPIPKYPSHKIMFSYFKNPTKEELKQMLHLSELLMKEGLSNGSSEEEFIYWSALEYQIGFRLFDKAWAQLYPHKEKPLWAKNDYKELYKNNVYHKKNAALWDDILDHNKCPRKTIDRFYEEEIEIFALLHQKKYF
jgi:hypothetical protein